MMWSVGAFQSDIPQVFTGVLLLRAKLVERDQSHGPVWEQTFLDRSVKKLHYPRMALITANDLKCFLDQTFVPFKELQEIAIMKAKHARNGAIGIVFSGDINEQR